jgi:hypothetical protein
MPSLRRTFDWHHRPTASPADDARRPHLGARERFAIRLRTTPYRKGLPPYGGSQRGQRRIYEWFNVALTQQPFPMCARTIDSPMPIFQ